MLTSNGMKNYWLFTSTVSCMLLDPANVILYSRINSWKFEYVVFVFKVILLLHLHFSLTRAVEGSTGLADTRGDDPNLQTRSSSCFQMARVIPSIRRIVRWPLSSPREVLQSLLYRSLCLRWWSSDRQLPKSGQSSPPLLHYLYLCLSLVGDWIYLFESHLCEIFVVSVLIEKFFRLLDFESCTYLLAGIQLLSTIGRSYWKKNTSIWRRRPIFFDSCESLKALYSW